MRERILNMSYGEWKKMRNSKGHCIIEEGGERRKAV
jgi:hypothetical protein